MYTTPFILHVINGLSAHIAECMQPVCFTHGCALKQISGAPLQCCSGTGGSSGARGRWSIWGDTEKIMLLPRNTLEWSGSWWGYLLEDVWRCKLPSALIWHPENKPKSHIHHIQQMLRSSSEGSPASLASVSDSELLLQTSSCWTLSEPHIQPQDSSSEPSAFTSERNNNTVLVV